MRRDEFPIVEKYCKDKIIAELEKIKDEIGIYCADCFLSISENDENCQRCNDTMFGSVLGIVDKHIVELKGE